MRYLLLWLLSLPAVAGELLIHGPSVHFGGGFNNENYGIGYAFDSGLVAGTYKNSIDNQTVYLGYCVPLGGEWSLLAGAATGYQYSVVPAALVSYRVPMGKHWGVRVNLIPFGKGAVNLTLGYRL